MFSFPLFTNAYCLLPIAFFIFLPGCSGPAPVWPEVNFTSAAPQPLKIGAAAYPITPSGPIFTAGGIPYRTAFTAHDDLWARAVVFDDGSRRIALVALDLIGINYDDVVRIRDRVADDVDIDYLLVAATHTHTAPDLVGFWSPTIYQFDDFYRKYLRLQVTRAVRDALASAVPAVLKIAAAPAGQPMLQRDIREPEYLDDQLTVWQAIDADAGRTIATVIHYATHPVLVPSYCFDISADFPHYLRLAVENGMDGDDGPVPAQGGVCIYFNADMAGRLFPESAEPLTVNPETDPTFAAAHAYGYRLAHRAMKIFTASANTYAEPMTLAAATKTLRVPITNILLYQGANMHIIDRGLVDGAVNTEVGIARAGPLEFFAIPGMIFPELVRGNFGPVPGSDFPDAPPESPALAELAQTEFFIPVGLANDILGYIIPKCLWDEKEPWVSSENAGQYGEVVAPSPDTAAQIMTAFNALR